MPVPAMPLSINVEVLEASEFKVTESFTVNVPFVVMLCDELTSTKEPLLTITLLNVVNPAVPLIV